MLKVLITGGAGFIGSRLAGALLQAGHGVRILDALLPAVHGAAPWRQAHLRQLAQDAELVHADVRDAGMLAKALRGQDVVVHLAAETGTGQSMYQIAQCLDVNSTATGTLLEQIKRSGNIQRLVLASSRAVYGEGSYRDRDGLVFTPDSRRLADLQAGCYEPQCPKYGGDLQAVATTEHADLSPGSVYGLSKLSQEQLCLTMGPVLGISVMALRYQNVYGPGQSLCNPYTGILAIFSNLLRQQHPVTLFEDGLSTRDFVYIDDVVTYTARAVEAEGADSMVLNIGQGQASTIHSIAEALRGCFESSAAITVNGRFRAGDIRHNFAAMQQTRQLLGEHEMMPVEAGLAHFCDWVQTQSCHDTGLYRAALAELHKG